MAVSGFGFGTQGTNPFAAQQFGGQSVFGAQPLQQIVHVLQIVPQQLQQLLQLQYLQQQQLQQLQQVLQIIPAQLAQFQQLIPFGPQQIQQLHQPYGTGFPTLSPWGLSAQIGGGQAGYVM